MSEPGTEQDVFDRIVACCNSEGGRTWVSSVLRNYAQRARTAQDNLPPIMDAARPAMLSREWTQVVNWLDARKTDPLRVTRVSAPQAFASMVKEQKQEANREEREALKTRKRWDLDGWRHEGMRAMVLHALPADRQERSVRITFHVGQWRVRMDCVDGDGDIQSQFLVDLPSMEAAQEYVAALVAHEEECTQFLQRIKGTNIRVQSRLAPDVTIHICREKDHLSAYLYQMALPEV